MPPGLRREAFERFHGHDPELYAEVTSLLEQAEAIEATSFLPPPTVGDFPTDGGNTDTDADADTDPAGGELAPGDLVRPYEVVRTLGRGGMGIVYLARRVEDFEQQVALKLIGGSVRPSLLRRFHSERQLLARLDHPNVVRLLGGGTTPGGVPYLVMEYVDGGPLDAHCRAHALPLRARVERFLKVVRAVAYAHDQGFLHRDLKPANILVTAGGVPKVTDFGLARAVSPLDVETATGEGEVLGTPGYTAPEQILGGPGRNGPGVDCYSLGAVLYRLLTDRHPFEGQTAIQTCLRVAETEPVPVRRRNPAVPRDLETVVLTAMAREPSARYATPAALADDLTRFLDDRPVLARRPGRLARAAKWARRHRRGLLVGLATLVLGALAGLAASTAYVWKAYRAEARMRRQAETVEADLRRTVADLDAILGEMNGLSDMVVKHVPGMDERQREYLETSLATLARRADAPGARASVRLEAVRAETRLGAFHYERPPGSEAGSAHFRSAARRAGELLADEPGDADARYEWARATRMLGLHALCLRTPDAEPRLRAALPQAELRARAQPDRATFQELQASLLGDLSGLCFSAGRADESIGLARRSLAINEALARRYPDHPLSHIRLADAWHGLAVWLRAVGRWDEAVDALRRSVAADDELAARHPNPLTNRALTLSCRGELGQALADLGRPEEAAGLLRRAVADLDRFVRESRPQPTHRIQLGEFRQQLAHLELRAGDAAAAAAGYRRAREDLAAAGTDPNARTTHARVLLITPRGDRGDPRQAEALCRGVLADRPDDPEAPIPLGIALVLLDRPAEALPLLEPAARGPAPWAGHAAFYAALAHLRLDHPDEARRAWVAATRRVEARPGMRSELALVRAELEPLFRGAP